MPRPNTVDSLRSFLGMATYLGQRFVPNFSSMCQPLWSLLSQPRFKWTESATAAYFTVRDAISKPVTLAYFDNTQPVTLTIDASPTDLGATILQNERLVACASCKLTDTESRYSQIEREFLTIMFGVHRFRQLLLGHPFAITTDHKPLLSFFKKPIDSLPLRIQRWMLSLQSFNFTIDFIAGRDNCLADSLSCNPLQKESCAKEQAEYTVCFLLTSTPISLPQVAQHTATDATLQRLVKAIHGG